ncbi:hypothetical protein GQ53DRAFT_882293, partial [Thozetella sp. PMI_491]
LSEQLYQTPTHFLLELIQNADDNSFPAGVEPSLSLSLYSRKEALYFRTDCNEVGFTLQQINALALVGQSTKSAKTEGQRGYIGEKGIGFKSVFKVADIVNISSGHYEFKFDRNQPIGMILPINSPFPTEDLRASNTQVLLHLKRLLDYERIQKDLEAIEPQLLMFLRNIRILHIITPSSKRIYRVQVTESDAQYRGETMVISSDGPVGKDQSKYIIVRHPVRDMPLEKRRPGITTSEVVLAFPIQDPAKPKLDTQSTFAFLPIDNFGFHFLIHADFLLVASREALEYALPWNLTLKSGIREAFLQAVDRFVSMPEFSPGEGLCYAWPRYLSRSPSQSGFWNSLYSDILKGLRFRRILMSRDPGQGPRMPSRLRFVPPQFRLHREGLFDSNLHIQSHLAFHYDIVHEYLAQIGVTTMSLKDLLDEFIRWTTANGAAELNIKSPEWHRKIAEIFCDQESLRHILVKLPIVPLRDRLWVSADSSRLYFPSESEDEHVPRGLDISIVDPAAYKSMTRRRFFQFLGIRNYSPQEVCRLIRNLHSKGIEGTRTRLNADLISDVKYLFKHRSQASSLVFLARKNGSRSIRTTRQIYLVDPDSKLGLIAKYRNTPGCPFNILDDQYESEICGPNKDTARQFRKWLLESPSCSDIPTLVAKHQLTKEWTFLRRTDVMDLLLLLRQYERRGTGEIFAPTISEAVPDLPVPCGSGGHKPLRQLAVPTWSLQHACPNIEFAKLPEPETWLFLSHFGISTVPDTQARLRDLRALRSKPLESVTMAAVHQHYLALSQSDYTEENWIVVAFMAEPLVLVDKPTLRWVRHGQCVWTAPRPLTRAIKLSRTYKDCKVLFCDYLDVKPANIRDAVEEFCHLPSEGSRAPSLRCAEVLDVLNDFINKGSKLRSQDILKIQSTKAFPVLTAEQGSHARAMPEVSLRALKDSRIWYLPDRISLETAFQGMVDLLHFSGSSAVRVLSLEGLLTQLGAHSRFLSIVVKEQVETRGDKIRDQAKERDLKLRLKYITRYVL